MAFEVYLSFKPQLVQSFKLMGGLGEHGLLLVAFRNRQSNNHKSKIPPYLSPVLCNLWAIPYLAIIFVG